MAEVMAWSRDVSKLRYRLKQMREQMGALEREVEPLLDLTDGLVQHNAVLQAEVERARAETRVEGRSVDGLWVGPDELRDEILKADAWKRKYDEAEREIARLKTSYDDAVRAGHVRYLDGRVEKLTDLVRGLLIDRLRLAGECPECDGGWVWTTCGEGTCEDLSACPECNPEGLRVSWDQRMGEDEDA